MERKAIREETIYEFLRRCSPGATLLSGTPFSGTPGKKREIHADAKPDLVVVSSRWNRATRSLSSLKVSGRNLIATLRHSVI
jgi:hypothetical protein